MFGFQAANRAWCNSMLNYAPMSVRRPGRIFAFSLLTETKLACNRSCINKKNTYFQPFNSFYWLDSLFLLFYVT